MIRLIITYLQIDFLWFSLIIFYKFVVYFRFKNNVKFTSNKNLCWIVSLSFHFNLKAIMNQNISSFHVLSMQNISFKMLLHINLPQPNLSMNFKLFLIICHFIFIDFRYSIISKEGIIHNVMYMLNRLYRIAWFWYTKI